MTLLNYTDPIPTPTPVTSGTTVQSYTDPTGEVWVALNGVNGGQWKKARDVLHARWYKAAAQNTISGAIAVSLDTVTRDPYGLYSVANNFFVPPVPGLYLFSGQVTVNAGAAGQAYSTRLYVNGNYQAIVQLTSQVAGSLTLPASLTWYMNVTDYFQLVIIAPAIVGIVAASFWTFAAVDYLGTG